jgi:hypothetical protein
MADRLAWTDGQLHVGEVMITTQIGVSIHDGSEKVRRDFLDKYFPLDLFIFLDRLSERFNYIN